MARLIRRFVKNDAGATAVEYGLMIAVLSLAIVAGVGTAGGKLEALWSDNNSRLVKGMK